MQNDPDMLEEYGFSDGAVGNRMTYAIYAVRYAGPLESSGAFVHWNRDWDARVLRNYYVWCLRSADQTVVIDTGVPPDAGESRGLPGYVSVDEALARLRVTAHTVDHVILTHLHFDHAGGIGLFPAATFYVQRTELDFWLDDPVSRTAPFRQLCGEETLVQVQRLGQNGRLQALDGDTEVLSGIRCISAPGHTPGLQVVSVHTERGQAVVASDCGHFFRNFAEEWPSCLIADLPSWLRSFPAVKSQADAPDLVFPGHDPRLTSDYPAVAEGITRLA